MSSPNKKEETKGGLVDSLPTFGLGKKEEVKKEEAPEVGTMKKGDYMIHVFIETVKQIKMPADQTVDPIVEISCLNEKKFTSAKDNISSAGVVTWMEHVFFEPKGVGVEDIEGAKISIKLNDKGYFKDAMIGIYEFDIAYIYFMKDHVLLHQWVAMSNPQSAEFNEVTAYMKLSISVATTGDPQIQINEDTGGAAADDENIMMPPSIKPVYYQLKIRFFIGQKLPYMDTAVFGKGGSIDAYIICQHLNQKLKTKVYTMKNDLVVWNQEFLIPCPTPIMSGRLVMKVFDQDKLSDEIVGSIIFNMKDLVKPEMNGRFFWKNIYGSPLDVSGETTNLMNNNPDIGSTWKGRILIQAVAEETEKPEIKVQDLTEEIIQLSAPHQAPHEYEVMAEVGVGIALPSTSKYSIKIKIADFEIRTEKAAHQENTFNRWNFRTQKLTFTSPYQDIYDMGRVYIYLMDGEKPISFHKQNIEDFLDPNPKIQWIELEPDLSIGKIQDHYKAGVISFKLSINDKTLNGPIDFATHKTWKTPIPKRPLIKKVRAFVYQCRDLPAADTDGQSDPYIELWDNNKESKKTKYIEDNVNPLFYEAVDLQYEANSINEIPPFILDVYDKDFGPMDGDDFICRAIIPISEASYTEKDEVPTPKWHPCRLKKGAPNCGEILISFAIVEDDYVFKIPLKYVNLMETVRFEEYTVEINVLGLRDLQSVGYLPVKKAFIQFNLKSLVPPDCAQAIENIKTQPVAPGPNPTINTLIKFTLPLPGDSLFCPKLQCSVFDNIFKSFLQPLLGVFTIPMGDILFGKMQQKQQDLDDLEATIKGLTEILDGLGVTAYNILPVPLEVEDIDFRQSIAEQKDKVLQNFNNTRSKIKVDAESKTQKLTPLLLGNDEEQQNLTNAGSRKGSGQVQLTPRRTPRDFMAVDEDGEVIENFDKAQSGLKNQLIAERLEEEERVKRELEMIREQELEEFKQKGESSAKVVILPEYQLDERLKVHREVNIPPESLYMGLGFDEVPEDKKRHYRRYYMEELEKVKEVMPKETPFDQFIIKRGQTRGASKGWWPFSGAKKEDESGEANTELVAGKFKGLITIESEKNKNDFKRKKQELLEDLVKKLNALSLKKIQKLVHFNLKEFETFEGKLKFKLQMQNLGVSHLNIDHHLQKIQSGDTLKRLLLGETKCIVRVYILSAFDLSSRDNGSPSDPYLAVSLGKKTYNDKDNYQLDEPNPDFYKQFEFETTFPGCPPLNVQLFDYDDLFGDDLIGETKIDLEDRFFSPEWQACKQKPIEFRSLYHQSSSMSQGVVKLWVDILKSSGKPEDQTPYDITPKPPEKFEVRVVVYDTLDIKGTDIGGTSDTFIRTFFDSKEEVKETDTHFRCSDGKASFNYRHLFHIDHPRKNYTLSIQAYDRDFFKSNDIVGEGRINLKLALEDAALAKRPVSINKSYYKAYLQKQGLDIKFKDDDSFWVELVGTDEKGNMEQRGKVRIRVDIYPIAHAEMGKVGEARNEPNANPFLTPPIGRLSFSFNPFKMFEQLVPPSVRRKIYLGCCLAICIALCVSMFPMILSNIVASWFTF